LELFGKQSLQVQTLAAGEVLAAAEQRVSGADEGMFLSVPLAPLAS
jgi:hypothetical protein